MIAFGLTAFCSFLLSLLIALLWLGFAGFASGSAEAVTVVGPTRVSPSPRTAAVAMARRLRVELT